MLSRKGSDRTAVDKARPDGDSAAKGMSAAVVGFTADLDNASKEAVDEMQLYEEVSLMGLTSTSRRS